VTYSLQTSNCDGSSSAVKTSRSCTVPLSVLQASPFSLILNDSILVKVIAINAYGKSDLSSAGNGAKMLLVPDAPVNLLNDAAITSNSVIRFTWSDGASNGGTSIINY